MLEIRVKTCGRQIASFVLGVPAGVTARLKMTREGLVTKVTFCTSCAKTARKDGVSYKKAHALLRVEGTVFVKHQRRMQLVGAPQPASEPSNTRLTLGDYIADVLLDTRHNQKIYHWIVQQVGSPAIIQWGQESTFEEAQSAANSYLQSLNSEAERKKA